MTGILQDCTCHESSNNIYTHYYNNDFVPESTTYDFTFNNIPYVTLKIEKKNLIVINLLLFDV
jgi:hypothetical protein